MFYLACTRFNSKTYQENKDYRIKCGESVIYGPAFKIRDIYSSGTLIFVAEMNNETNKIEGIGLIKNLLVSDKHHKIYENNEYNRYVYKGKYWLSRTQLNELDTEITEIFDNILFKGKSNLKRMSGITIITEKLFTNWDYKLYDLKSRVKNAFLKYFKHHIDLDCNEIQDKEEIEKEKEEIEETFDIIPKKRRRLNNDNNIEI